MIQEGEKRYSIAGVEYYTSELTRLCSTVFKLKHPSKRCVNDYINNNKSLYPPGMTFLGLATNLLYEGYKIPEEPAKRKPKDEDKVWDLVLAGIKFSEKNVKENNTKASARVELMLTSCGIPFEKELSIVIERSKMFNDDPKLYIIDFWIKYPYNFCLEVDGGYHDTPQQIEYDKVRTRCLWGKGLGPMIRIRNEVALDKEFNLVKYLIKNANARLKKLLIQDFYDFV